MKGIQMTVFEPEVKVVRDAGGKIVQGLTVGDTLRQNQAMILVLRQGELKEWPAVGCGIADMLLDNDPIYWRSKVREQLEMDGQKVNQVKISTTGITIDANY